MKINETPIKLVGVNYMNYQSLNLKLVGVNHMNHPHPFCSIQWRAFITVRSLSCWWSTYSSASCFFQTWKGLIKQTWLAVSFKYTIYYLVLKLLNASTFQLDYSARVSGGAILVSCSHEKENNGRICIVGTRKY